ncbi:MAG TPA: VWA domain-containing protein [Edaphocola sp.]|nr:VWA domain-containing protein [Edaphocola sp.]
MPIPFTTYIFASPWFLLLFLTIPILYFYYKKNKSKRKLTYTLTTTLGIQQHTKNWKVRWKPYLPYLNIIALSLMILALARPQDTAQRDDLQAEGIDIVLCIDISPSMEAEDLQPSRIEAAKAVAINFVKDRPTDKIGLVVFAGESFTQVPVTIDHNLLIEQIKHLNSNLLSPSTAIGMGLASSVNSLKDISGKSKVIILLTDGVNESGTISPETALEIAMLYKIKVYTVGVGGNGTVFMPIKDEAGNVISRQRLPVSLDEPLMKKIANNTGGKYFRATDNNSLQEIYKEINQLEKRKIEGERYAQYKDLFFSLLLIATLILLLQLILKYTIFRSIT